MATLARLYRYCKLHLFRDPRYLFTYVINYLSHDYTLNINFYSDEQVGKLVAKGKSLIRFGDGEIYLLNHGDIPFEPSVPELRFRMSSIISEYSDDAPYVLGLNELPLSKTNHDLRIKGLLSCWLPSKVYYNLYFNKKASYADAAMFYFRETIPAYFESYLMGKRIIFVSNRENCNQFIANDRIPFEHSQTVVTPETSSFSEYSRIRREVEIIADKNGRGNTVVLAAFGPASKILAFELSQNDIQVLDVGQGVMAAYTDADHSLSENIRVLQ